MSAGNIGGILFRLRGIIWWYWAAGRPDWWPPRELRAWGPKSRWWRSSGWGGDCLNVGCVPSKALIRAARAVAAVRKASAYGVLLPGGWSVDFGAIMERVRRVRADLSPHDSARRFTELGVDVFFGSGRFAGGDKIEVNGESLRFAKAVIATGARAAAPPIRGLNEVPYLTNESLFSLTELPRRLGVIGAGPIGCEMAQCFARLGSEVTLVESTRGLLPREDRDASAVIRSVLLREGVQIRGGGKDVVVSQTGRGIGMRCETGSAGWRGEVDRLLVAVGRAPNVEGLGLESAGIEFGPEGVKVDDFLRTTHPRVFACGDVCSAFQFTHVADFMARLALRNALFGGRARLSRLIIPWCTYTSPELARVGMIESEARERGVAVDTFTQELNRVDRAYVDGEDEGFVRVHVRKGSDRVVGATVVSSHAGDLIGEIVVAMNAGAGLGGLSAAIHPYPTVAEAIRKTGDLYQRTRLTPLVRSLMGRWLAWGRSTR